MHQRRQLAGQGLSELLVAGGLLEPARQLGQLRLDPGLVVAVEHHLLEHLQRPGDLADLVGAPEPGHHHIVVPGGQAIHQIGGLAQRPDHRQMAHAQHVDSEQHEQPGKDGADQAQLLHRRLGDRLARGQQRLLGGLHPVERGQHFFDRYGAPLQIVAADLPGQRQALGRICRLQATERCHELPGRFLQPLLGQRLHVVGVGQLHRIVADQHAQPVQMAEQLASARSTVSRSSGRWPSR